MIRSMTAFGNATTTFEQGTATVELRSVNGRFLDLHFRLGDDIRHLEAPLREKLTTALSRGKVELRATLTRRTQVDPSSLNQAGLHELARMLNTVREVIPQVEAPRFADVLAWPGVQTDAADPELWNQAVLQAADEALKQLQGARLNEGARLAQMMNERAQAMHEIVTGIEAEMPRILSDYNERLSRKLRESIESAFPGGFQNITGAELSERITHEAALFSLRIDVAEELSRLKSHLTELDHILAGKAGGAGGKNKSAAKSGGSAGKRLDFLFQEMNREANTLGSKAGALEMTRAAVDLKLLIEQLREQAQNLE